MQFRSFLIAFCALVLVLPLTSHAFISNDVLEVENARRISDRAKRALQIRHLSDRGNSQAMVELGAYYRAGSGVAKDETEAKRLFQKAADLGNPWAMKALGNHEMALKTFLKEADRGDGNSSYGIALMYMFGKGVQKNNAETTRWLQKASEQGSINAMYMLGLEYQDSNRDEAIRLFRKAASLGHGNAAAMAQELEAKIR